MIESNNLSIPCKYCKQYFPQLCLKGLICINCDTRYAKFLRNHPDQIPTQ